MLRPFGLALRALRSSNFAQILVDELHGYRSFTYSRGHSFDGAVPHVPYGEYTGNVGLEQERISFKWPILRSLTVSYQVGTRQYEPSFVALDEIREPLGSRQRSNKDEHRRGGYPLNLIRVGTEEGNLFQMGFAVNFRHACVWPNLDVGGLLDLIDQVL
jgi:hypothetical protein